MMKLVDMKDIHKGRTAGILGGGPSLLSDMEHLPEDALLIAVNHHASYTGIEPDYMVFMDDPIHFPLLEELIPVFDGVRIAPLMQYTDIDMRGANYWNGPCTDKVAVWIACHFGCDPVILCGMDMYQGEVKYSHAGEPDFKPIYNIELKEHLQRWKRGFLPGVCPGIERVRAVSGPLLELYEKEG